MIAALGLALAAISTQKSHTADNAELSVKGTSLDPDLYAFGQVPGSQFRQIGTRNWHAGPAAHISHTSKNPKRGDFESTVLYIPGPVTALEERMRGQALRPQLPTYYDNQGQPSSSVRWARSLPIVNHPDLAEVEMPTRPMYSERTNGKLPNTTSLLGFNHEPLQLWSYGFVSDVGRVMKAPSQPLFRPNGHVNRY